MPCARIRDCWCDTVGLNVHATAEDESDHKWCSFHEEPERVLDQFSRIHMNIISGDFNAKEGTEDVFEPIIGNKFYVQVVMINRVTVIKFAS
jgi:hypothetical protein